MANMSYKINLGVWNSVFAVPSCVVDDHLKLAGSAQLKVLLWFLRHSGEAKDAEEIGKILGLPKADVCDAMQYWIEVGIISENNGSLVPTEAADIQTESVEEVQTQTYETVKAPENVISKPANTAVPVIKEKPRLLNASEIATRITSSDEIRFMLDAAEEIFGRPLSTPENGALLCLYDYDGLPADVVIMMIQYAFDQGKCNMRYIEKMASGWIENGIDTHEKAEEYLKALAERKSAWNVVRKLFGINERRPSKTEEECSARWINEWHFSEEMLREAYDRCIDATGKVQFKYINQILERWNSNGIMTIADVLRKDDGESKKTKSPKSASSYDLAEFEKTLYGGNEG